MHGMDSGGGFPFPGFLLPSRGGPRRPYTPQSLQTVRLIVGLGVIAALLWLAIALH
jgi:hypothetical protein